MLMLGTAGRGSTGRASVQAVGKALLVSWVRTDQEYVIRVAVFGGRSQGCSWSLWGWSCPFPFQEALLPVLAGGFYVCVRACVCVYPGLSLVICTAPWKQSGRASGLYEGGSNPPWPPYIIATGWSPGWSPPGSSRASTKQCWAVCVCGWGPVSVAVHCPAPSC